MAIPFLLPCFSCSRCSHSRFLIFPAASVRGSLFCFPSSSAFFQFFRSLFHPFSQPAARFLLLKLSAEKPSVVFSLFFSLSVTSVSFSLACSAFFFFAPLFCCFSILKMKPCHLFFPFPFCLSVAPSPAETPSPTSVLFSPRK